MFDQRAPIFSADTYLSSGPFGDSNYLSANTSKLYGHLARMIASRLGIHVPLIEEKHTDSQRTILRRELDFAFAEMVEGKPISTGGPIKNLCRDRRHGPAGGRKSGF